MEINRNIIRHEELLPAPLKTNSSHNRQKFLVPKFVSIGPSPRRSYTSTLTIPLYPKKKKTERVPQQGGKRMIPATHIHHKQTFNNNNNNIQRSSIPIPISTISRSATSANAATLLDPTNLYHHIMEPPLPILPTQQHNDSLCANCHRVIQVPEKTTTTPPPEMSLPMKSDGSWNFNHQIHHPIQRNNSIGGFTLTGQDTRKIKRSRMSKFCSSHKIALVVSTFSFLVTIGLTITLILMKNKGMMEPM